MQDEILEQVASFRGGSTFPTPGLSKLYLESPFRLSTVHLTLKFDGFGVRNQLDQCKSLFSFRNFPKRGPAFPSAQHSVGTDPKRMVSIDDRTGVAGAVLQIVLSFIIALSG